MQCLEIAEDQPGLHEDGMLPQVLKASALRIINASDQQELTLTLIPTGIGGGDKWIFGLVSRLTYKILSTTPGWALDNLLVPICVWRRFFR